MGALCKILLLSGIVAVVTSSVVSPTPSPSASPLVPPDLLGSLQTCFDEAGCTNLELEDQVMPVVKELEKKLLNSLQLTLQEAYLFTKVHDTLDSIITTSLCDPFIAPLTLKPAVCCKVMIGNEEIGVCAYTDLILSTLPQHHIGVMVFECDDGTASVTYNPAIGGKCWASPNTALSGSSRYYDYGNPYGWDSWSTPSSAPSSTLSPTPSSTQLNDPDESNTVYVDLRSLQCGGDAYTHLCTQYCCDPGKGSDFCEADLRCY